MELLCSYMAWCFLMKRRSRLSCSATPSWGTSSSAMSSPSRESARLSRRYFPAMKSWSRPDLLQEMNCQYLSLKVIWRGFGGYHSVGEWLLSTGIIEDCHVFSKENFFLVPRISRRLFQVTTRSSSEAWPGSRGLWSPLLRTMTTSPFLHYTARWSMWPPMSTSSLPWLGTRSFTQSQSCSFQSFLSSSLSSSLDYWRWSNSLLDLKLLNQNKPFWMF